MPSQWWNRPRQLSVAAFLAVVSLSLSPVHAASEKTAKDYYVGALPGAPKDRPLVKMHAGHIEVTPEASGHLFFWHFANNRIIDRQRTVIWINGGPGCSSEDGALMEIGPYRTTSDGGLQWNNGTWNEFANLLFVDNPVGTGFSYVNTDSYISELDEMADQFVILLEKWFDLFPEYRSDDLYIAGESYAGQHIPYIAKAILDRNAKKDDHHDVWNLQGLIIGNGWISPREQYDSYLKFAYEKDLVKKGSDVAQELQGAWRNCDRLISTMPDRVDVPGCEVILTGILSKTRTKGPDGKERCLNMYDVRLTDSWSSCGMNWPPDLENLTPYLRRDDVKLALNLNKQLTSGWTECNGAVSQHFKARHSKPSIQLLPGILEQVPITLFSGAEDLICNHLGTEAFVGNMKWNGGKGFDMGDGETAPRRNWTFEGQDAGFWQEARNLTYVLFKEASHMVPFDWPRRSRDMLDRVVGIDVHTLGTDSKIEGEKGKFASQEGNGSCPECGTESSAVSGGALGVVDSSTWKATASGAAMVLFLEAIVGACIWAWFQFRERRKRAGYRGIPGTGDDPGDQSGVGMSRLRSSRPGRGGENDIEAGDFDETALDDLHSETPKHGGYDIAGTSDDDVEETKPANGGTKNGRRLTGR